MSAIIPICSGDVYGNFTVIEQVRTPKGIRYRCQCICGNTSSMIRSYDLRKLLIQSCGCLKIERFYRLITKHGLAEHPLYDVWQGIKKRCYNSRDKEYKNYGGRGIRMCDTWRTNFKQFYDDMLEGYAQGLQIDRIDNDGNYTKENCRWVTPAENVRNRRRTIRIEFEGRSLTLQELSELTGVSYDTLNNRYHRGIPFTGKHKRGTRRA